MTILRANGLRIHPKARVPVAPEFSPREIPEFPCPHIDLRWPCYHHRWRRGLKEVEAMLGIRRPADLQGVDGAEAVWLWFRWKHYQDREARELLLRYCGADVVTLPLVAAALLREKGAGVREPVVSELWGLL